MEFSNDKPIYLQIVDYLLIQIVTKQMKDDKLASVRDLAMELQVNPNTIQKAYSELENMKVVESRRTSGRYLVKNDELFTNLKNNLAFSYSNTYFKQMNELGFSNEDAIKYLINKEDK